LFGGVDILVNNAGIRFVSPIEDFPAARWDAIIAINFSSAFHATAAALPLMRARGWGVFDRLLDDVDVRFNGRVAPHV
jgi:3-hydroxybutyrate dehydrogenase